MNPIVLLAVLAAGVLLGAVIGYLYARGTTAAATGDLMAQARAADERARAAAEQAALVDGYLAERFQALSAQALDASQQRLAELSELRMRAVSQSAAGELDARKNAVEQLVGPLGQTLQRVEAQLREAEAARRASHAVLTEQIRSAVAASDQLRAQAQALVTALRRPEARGRWGEMQLRRVAELAGMSDRCDFDEQVSVTVAAEGAHGAGAHGAGAGGAGAGGAGAGGAGARGERTLRPDMVVRLAGDKNIVVDSKVSLSAYLEAAEATEEQVRDARLAAHARHLKEHVNDLAAKAYWAALRPSPEFVVLFIPGEAFLAPALERDPELLEYAMARRVHIATPTTLISLLRTAQYAWQQEALSANARAVFDLGRELYERVGVLSGHLDAVGKSLTGAVTAYNRVVGSLEGRVLVTARRLRELGVTDSELAAPRPSEAAVRALAAPELVTETTANGSSGPVAVHGATTPTGQAIDGSEYEGAHREVALGNGSRTGGAPG